MTRSPTRAFDRTITTKKHRVDIKKQTFLKKKSQIFCQFKNNPYLCIAIEKEMHS